MPRLFAFLCLVSLASIPSVFAAIEAPGHFSHDLARWKTTRVLDRALRGFHAASIEGGWVRVANFGLLSTLAGRATDSFGRDWTESGDYMVIKYRPNGGEPVIASGFVLESRGRIILIDRYAYESAADFYAAPRTSIDFNSDEIEDMLVKRNRGSAEVRNQWAHRFRRAVQGTSLEKLFYPRH